VTLIIADTISMSRVLIAKQRVETFARDTDNR
jgi:hypothetical protein